ncbi:MAG: fused MFS/spermidine synthase, partial [bacterium]
KDGLTGRITVRALSAMEMAFIVNGKPDGSTSLVDMYTQIFMAHLPALAHPHPRRVLVIGMGTGTTTGCLTLHPEIEEIHLAEIEPAQIDVARWFSQHNYHALDNPKVHVHLDDARHFLLTDKSTYDVIVSEPSNLFVSGMVNLFTEEFYRTVRAHLNPGGVFFQWIHYYRVDAGDVRGMLRTFSNVFPDTTFWIHQFGDAFLLTRQGGLTFDLAEWDRRLNAPPLVEDFKRIQLVPGELLGFYLWGPRDLRAYADGAPAVTDDRPYLEFSTPRVRYTQDDVRDMRVAMQTAGPLEPMPLVREDASSRLRLGDMFFARGSLARAEAEYRRILVLAPGHAGATARRARLARLLQGTATPAAPGRPG